MSLVAVDGISAERLSEICRAEQEGRLVVLPPDGMLYYIESIEETGESWVGNKPLRYIDGEGYHCGWGLATLRFELSDLGKTIFLTSEAAELALSDKRKTALGAATPERGKGK